MTLGSIVKIKMIMSLDIPNVEIISFMIPPTIQIITQQAIN